MDSIFQPELIIVVLVWLLILACVAALFLGVWLLYKTLKKLNRLEAELKSMGEELHSLKVNYPPTP